MIAYCGYSHGKMSVHGASTIFGHASWEITPPIGCIQSQRNFWPPLLTKQTAIPSLPHHENEHQRSVNDFWSCVLGNHTSDRLYSVINEFLAAFIGKTDSNTLPAPS